MTTSIQSIDSNTSAMLVNGTEAFRMVPAGIEIQNINGGQLSGMRNKIINGAFAVNQRGIVTGSNVAIAADQYFFDRWKAGAAGAIVRLDANGGGFTCTVQSGTIAQVIENVNIAQSGSYTLSHEGNATARIAKNGEALSGAFVEASKTSSLTVTGQNDKTTLTVEFSTGTVSQVMLEYGTKASSFEHKLYGAELLLCQRYYETGYGYYISTGSSGATVQRVQTGFRTTKRVAPSTTLTLAPSAATSVGLVVATVDSVVASFAVASAGQECAFTYTASAEL
jgi:hypothetical protein